MMNNFADKSWMNRPLDELIKQNMEKPKVKVLRVPDDDTALFKAGHRRRLRRSRLNNERSDVSESDTSEEDEDEEEERARYKRRLAKLNLPIETLMEVTETEPPTVKMPEELPLDEKMRKVEPPAVGPKPQAVPTERAAVSLLQMDSDSDADVVDLQDNRAINEIELLEIELSKPVASKVQPQHSKSWYRRQRRLRLRESMARKEIDQNKKMNNMSGLQEMPSKKKLLNKKKKKLIKMLGGMQWQDLDKPAAEPPLVWPVKPMTKKPLQEEQFPLRVGPLPVKPLPMETAPVKPIPVQPSLMNMRSFQPVPESWPGVPLQVEPLVMDPWSVESTPMQLWQVQQLLMELLEPRSWSVDHMTTQ